MTPRHLAFWLLLAVACASPWPASAVLIADSGAVAISGADAPVMLELTGPVDQLRGFTFGLFAADALTARPGDPDYALQALMADNVMLLHEAGQDVADRYDLGAVEGRVGLFVIQGATLEQFSRGQSPFRPVFSDLGAPGSHLLATDGPAFTLPLLAPGLVMGSGGASGGDAVTFALSQQTDRALPVIPEPATVLMTLGGGLMWLGARRRRAARP